jgi:hypothetical protein
MIDNYYHLVFMILIGLIFLTGKSVGEGRRLRIDRSAMKEKGGGGERNMSVTNGAEGNKKPAGVAGFSDSINPVRGYGRSD